MNQDQIRGVWKQIKGRAKLAWGDVADDPGARVEGSVDTVYGRFQQSFGDTKQAIKRGIGRLRMR